MRTFYIELPDLSGGFVYFGVSGVKKQELRNKNQGTRINLQELRVKKQYNH